MRHSFHIRRLLIASIVCSAALCALSQPAAAKLKASAIVQADGTGQRIIVTVTGSRAPSAKKKPRSVKVRAAGKTLKLGKYRASAARASATGYSSTWRSKLQTGDYAGKLAALGGKSVKVSLKSRSGTTTVDAKVVVQTGGGGQPAVPLFTPPPSALIGNEAFTYLSKWFLNSAFSDCQSVWPACSVEHRYVHCPNFSWEYHRNTLTSGSDIHAYDNFTVTGANVNADGSWAVSYVTGTGGNYVWQVATNGIATGQYTFSSTVENLGPMYWSQPAITWQQPAGAC